MEETNREETPVTDGIHPDRVSSAAITAVKKILEKH